jgi:acyl carrier protein
MEVGKKFSKKEIEEAIKEIISEIANVKKEELRLETKLREDLGIDSLSAAEIMFGIQEKFGIDVPSEKALNFKTVADIVKNLHVGLDI